MKAYNFFNIFIAWAILAASVSAQELPGTKDLTDALDEEIKWIRAEAEATTVTVATKTEMTDKEAPSIVSVITEEEIRNMGARNIADVLRTVPGFDLTDMGFYPMHQTYIWGMASTGVEKIKIMIDGHSFQPFWGDPDFLFDKLPIGSIRKIEIIRGPGSALYGTGAFLGVINIITKQGGDRPSALSVEYGSFDTVKPSAEFSYKKDRFKAYLYAEYYQTDGYDGTVESDMASDPAAVEMFGGLLAPSASREMTGEAKYYTFQSNISYDRFYFQGFFQKTKTMSPIGMNFILTDEDDLNARYAYGELGYKLPVGDKGNLLIKAYYDYSVYEADFEAYPEETAALHIGFPADEGICNGTYGKWSVSGIETAGDYELYPGIQAVAGASYENMKQFDIQSYANANLTGDFLKVGGRDYAPFPYQYFSGGYTDISENGNWSSDKSRDVFAGYVQCVSDLKKLFYLKKNVENLILTVGGRYDNYENVGSSVNPRFGIVYAPTEKLWLKALYGRAFRAPNFAELYLKNTPAKGNPDLEPETISTAELLVGYSFTKNISLCLTGFYVDGQDLILLSLSDMVYKNIGKMKSAGVESELKASFGKNSYAYLNFTWQDVKDETGEIIFGTDQKQKDFNPGMIPAFYGNMGLNYGLTEKLIGNVSLNYTGKRDRTDEMVWDGEKLVRLDTRDPVNDRWLLNLSLRFKDVFTKGMEFQISGFNLLNEDHRDPDTSGVILNDIPCEGRTFTGRLTYSF